jgi:uncharacterized protein (DUF488 family)
VARGWARARVFALGHSTLSAEEVVARLRAHGVRTLVDVRTVPRSRTNPQFDVERFARTLAEAGLGHAHVAELGGLRKPRKDTPNAGWRNTSFRGYADHMASEDFERGLERLRALALEGPVAVMCSEALRWRCHRSLLADALFARGVVVQHLVSAARAQPHVPTPFARFRGLSITYPPALAERVAREREAQGPPARRAPRPRVKRAIVQRVRPPGG